MITDAIESLADLGYKFAHFAWSHAPEGDYGTWGEDTGNEFKVGNVVAEQVMNGFLDFFTRDDSGMPQQDIQDAMTEAGVVWHLDAVQYESDTGYIHYTWEYHENG
jgi:hypothetical protein